MAGTKKSATKAYFRRKVTLACESCRKRRVKCSGSLPCSLCIDNGIKCDYDSSNRSRRGPRPHQPPSAPRNVPRLAPRPSPGLSATVEAASSQPQTATPPQTIEIDGVGESITCAAVDYPIVAVPGLDQDDSEDTDSDASEDGNIVTSKDWGPEIGNLIFSNNSTQANNAVDQERRLKLICHLIEAFHARGIKQLREILKPASFFSQISRGLLSDGLIFAICAYSTHLSVHDSVRRHDAAQTAGQLAQAARERLILAGTDWKHINDIRSVCILVEYETVCGNGRRAWADIAMGSSLLELAYSTILTTPEQKEILDIACNYLMQAYALHSLGRPQLQSRICQSHCISTTNYSEAMPSERTQQRINLLNIHQHIENLYSQPLSQDEPYYWVRNSRFHVLQFELEKQLIQANISSNEAQSPEAVELQAHQGSAEFLQLSLIWHLCAVALNRIFLPVPYQSTQEVTSQHSRVIFQQYPNAPPLFLSENISRCDASADAICLLVRQIVNQASFFHNPLLLGYACMNSALVLSNRLHRESEVRRKTTMGHLRVALAILKAVGLCYQPAKHWLYIVREAHLINDRLIYASKPTCSLFESFFSRFETLEEAPMVPLDPITSEYSSSEQVVNDEIEESGMNIKQGGTKSQQTTHGTENMAPALTWQQLYASHLSKVIDYSRQPIEESLSMPGQHAVGAVCEVTPCAAALLGGDELLDGTTGMQHMMHSGDEPDMADIHEAGAILTSLSGVDLNAMLNIDSGGWETGGGSFDELMTFLQMPSLLDMEGMNLDISQFI